MVLRNPAGIRIRFDAERGEWTYSTVKGWQWVDGGGRHVYLAWRFVRQLNHLQQRNIWWTT